MTLEPRRLTYPKPADELWISVEMAQEVLSKGNRIERPVQVMEGPDPEARIIGVELVSWDRMIVVKYDRPVPEPTFRSFESREAMGL